MGAFLNCVRRNKSVICTSVRYANKKSNVKQLSNFPIKSTVSYLHDEYPLLYKWFLQLCSVLILNQWSIPPQQNHLFRSKCLIEFLKFSYLNNKYCRNVWNANETLLLFEQTLQNFPKFLKEREWKLNLITKVIDQKFVIWGKC